MVVGLDKPKYYEVVEKTLSPYIGKAAFEKPHSVLHDWLPTVFLHDDSGMCISIRFLGLHALWPGSVVRAARFGHFGIGSAAC